MTITSTHKKRTVIQSILTNLAHFLATLKNTAEQLTDIQRWRVIVCRAFAKFINLKFPVGPQNRDEGDPLFEELKSERSFVEFRVQLGIPG